MVKLATFSSLKHKDFKYFWFGSIFSEVGSQMQIVAINWQIYQLTHSPWALGLVGLASFLPIPIFSLIGGITADKFDRKKILIYTQIFQGFLAVILFYITWKGLAVPIYIYALISLGFVAKTFQAPARQAIVPQLVPKHDFMNAVSLTTLAYQSAVVVGPAIAGFMIEFGGVQGVYLFNAVSYIFLIIALLPIKIDNAHLKNKVDYSIKSVLEGINFVRGNQVLYSTMLLDFLANFFASATTMLPIFAADILKTGAKGLGVMYSAPSIGAVMAGLFMASHTKLKHPGKLIIIGVLIYGIATIGFGLANWYYLSLLFLFFVGAGDMISTVLRNTIRQMVTPDNIKGRMVSINMVFIQGGPQLGELEAGILASFIGAPFAVAVGGVGAVASAVAIWFLIPKLRNYKHDVEVH